MLLKICKTAKHLLLHQRQFAEETLLKISSRKEFTSNSNFLEWQIFCNHRGGVSRRRFKRFVNSSPGLDSRVFVVGREWRDLPRILLSIWSKLKLIYSHFLLSFPASCFYWAKLRMEIWYIALIYHFYFFFKMIFMRMHPISASFFYLFWSWNCEYWFATIIAIVILIITFS